MTPLSFAFINEEEKQKDELDWYKYLKKKDDRNKEDDDDDNEHNINKSGMRDRVSKWFSREKKTESPPVKPIELQKEKSTKLIKKSKESLEHLLGQHPILPKEDDSINDKNENKKQLFFKKQEELRIQTLKAASSLNSTKHAVSDNTKTKYEINSQALDALQELRDLRKNYPMKEPNQNLDKLKKKDMLMEELIIEQDATKEPEDNKHENVYSNVISINEVGKEDLLQDYKSMNASISSQMYRSIASSQKGGGGSKEKQEEYANFLKKEEEMRRKLEHHTTRYVESAKDDTTTIEDLFAPIKATESVEQNYFSKGFQTVGFETRKKDLLEQTELTLEEVNNILQFSNPLEKLITINKPDSAFGAIFRLEGCLIDFTELYCEAWNQVYNGTLKEKEYLQPITMEEASVSQTMKAEDAIQNLFFWTIDKFEAQFIANQFHQTLGQLLMKDATFGSPMTVNEGAMEWLEQLEDFDIPYGIISYLNQTKLEVILNKTKLANFFLSEHCVTSNNGYENEAQQMLGVALRIERRPDHCVVFDTTPKCAIAAHTIEMANVAVMGLYPMYELNTADLTITSFEELNIINVRRLFSNKNFEPPQTELESERPKPTVQRLRRWAEGDRN